MWVRNSLSQFALGIPRKSSSYLHTKQRQLWLQSFSPITTNQNLTTLRHSHVPDTKNPLIRLIQRRPSVRSDSVLFLFEIIVTKLNSVWSLFLIKGIKPWNFFLFHNRISLASVLIYYGNYLVNWKCASFWLRGRIWLFISYYRSAWIHWTPTESDTGARIKCNPFKWCKWCSWTNIYLDQRWICCNCQQKNQFISR